MWDRASKETGRSNSYFAAEECLRKQILPKYMPQTHERTAARPVSSKAEEKLPWQLITAQQDLER